MPSACSSLGSVEKVADFKFLGLTIEEDLPWSAKTIALVTKAQQTLYLTQTPQKLTLGEAAGAL